MPTATITSIQPTRSKELLDEIQRLAARRLAEALNDVLTQADDVLFGLANCADNSKRQNLYFDAMRELRLNRGEIERSFIVNFNTTFTDSLDPPKAPGRSAASSFSGELSLVGLDEVEETLAISHFAESMRGRCGQELFALERRMGILLKAPKLDGESNPLGPKAIGTALRRACQAFETDIEVKLTLYKLFDKFAGFRLQQLYGDLNQLLTKANILPSVGNPAQAMRPGTTRKTRVIIESEQDRVEAAGDDVFGTLQQLLQGQPPGGGRGAAGIVLGGGWGAAGMSGGGAGGVGGVPGIFGNGSAEPGGHVGGFGAGYGTALAGGANGGGDGFVSVPMLVDNLTNLQRGAANGVVPAGFDATVLSAGNVNVLRGLRESGAVGQMAPTQDLTLEIVSLLFDYILDDPSIPDTLKALIGRLQIPVLKVAILDKDVFSKKSHPARRLLDGLARAAVGWSAGMQQSDALYDKIDAAVRRIAAEFDDDVGLFTEVLDDFEAFISAESATATARAEASTRSLHTREKIVLAKLAVDDALQARLRDHAVREFIQQFLFDYWRQLLIISHVEAGTESADWQAQLATVDELVWSTQPKTTPEDRKQLTARLPKLIKDIKRGMLALEMAPADCSRFLSMLASVHVVSIKQIEESSIAARKLVRTDAAPAIAGSGGAGTVDLNDPASEEFIKRGLARLFERKGGEPLELDIDFSAFETPAEEEAAADPALEAELGKYVALATTLDLGDWVEFQRAGGVTMRGRFTWISPSTGRYLFTGRQGETVLDITLLDLAREFKAGSRIIIRAESDPLLDRALGALIEKLEAEAAAA